MLCRKHNLSNHSASAQVTLDTERRRPTRTDAHLGNCRRMCWRLRELRPRQNKQENASRLACRATIVSAVSVMSAGAPLTKQEKMAPDRGVYIFTVSLKSRGRAPKTPTKSRKIATPAQSASQNETETGPTRHGRAFEQMVREEERAHSDEAERRLCHIHNALTRQLGAAGNIEHCATELSTATRNALHRACLQWRSGAAPSCPRRSRCGCATGRGSEARAAAAPASRRQC